MSSKSHSLYPLTPRRNVYITALSRTPSCKSETQKGQLTTIHRKMLIPEMTVPVSTSKSMKQSICGKKNSYKNCYKNVWHCQHFQHSLNKLAKAVCSVFRIIPSRKPRHHADTKQGSCPLLCACIQSSRGCWYLLAMTGTFRLGRSFSYLCRRLIWNLYTLYHG